MAIVGEWIAHEPRDVAVARRSAAMVRKLEAAGARFAEPSELVPFLPIAEGALLASGYPSKLTELDDPVRSAVLTLLHVPAPRGGRLRE